MVSEDNSFDVIDDASFHDEAAVKFVEAYKAVGNSVSVMKCVVLWSADKKLIVYILFCHIYRENQMYSI